MKEKEKLIVIHPIFTSQKEANIFKKTLQIYMDIFDKNDEFELLPVIITKQDINSCLISNFEEEEVEQVVKKSCLKLEHWFCIGFIIGITTQIIFNLIF